MFYLEPNRNKPVVQVRQQGSFLQYTMFSQVHL